MSEQQPQVTPGEQYLLSKPPTLTFGDRKYQLRKLGLSAMSPLARIVETAIGRGALKGPRDIVMLAADGQPLRDASGNPRLNV
ncbi:MAG: hypothetical protein PHE72_14715, partial [candidate division Zixibacteria bacterium]|nr:hypothetical protein [candidate division Zixibacteria bacterium]